jgi:hypothetical protein
MKSAFTLSAAVLGALLAALASGCASVDDVKAPADDTPRSQREAMTGSHIPNKTPLPPQSDEERAKTVERMKELQKTSVPVRTKE